MTQILVVEEKHGTYYYPAATPDELAASALQILTERFNAGYWYLTPDEMYDDNSQYDKNILTKLVPEYDPEADLETRQAVIDKWKSENIDTIKDEDARKVVTDKLYKAVKRQKDKRTAAKEFAELERVVKEQDLSTVTVGSGKWERQEPRAWRILDSRSDYEYEHVELEDLQEVKGLES